MLSFYSHLNLQIFIFTLYPSANIFSQYLINQYLLCYYISSHILWANIPYSISLQSMSLKPISLKSNSLANIFISSLISLPFYTVCDICNIQSQHFGQPVAFCHLWPLLANSCNGCWQICLNLSKFTIASENLRHPLGHQASWKRNAYVHICMKNDRGRHIGPQISK